VALDTSLVGQVVGRRVVVVERGPVAAFARAVKDPSPLYRDRSSALEAGFADIPVPPTFAFVMAYWGAFGELQDDLEPVPTNPMREIIDGLGPGLILHGEQDFEFERPILVGDVLHGEDVLSELYEKMTDALVMSFIVTTTQWRDFSTGAPGEAVATTRFSLIHRARRKRTSVL